MSASDHSWPAHGHPEHRPLGNQPGPKGDLLTRVRASLDGLGLLALLGAAVFLFASGMTDDSLEAGRLIRISIATLNASVLTLASARLLDMIDKAREGSNPGAQWFEPKRSSDQGVARIVGATERAGETASPAKDAAAATDGQAAETYPDIHYSPVWRTRARGTGATSSDPGAVETVSTLVLDDTLRRQDTDAPDTINPKSIH